MNAFEIFIADNELEDDEVAWLKEELETLSYDVNDMTIDEIQERWEELRDEYE